MGPRFQIQVLGNNTYAVIDIATGQERYRGSLDGARQAQAKLMAGVR